MTQQIYLELMILNNNSRQLRLCLLHFRTPIIERWILPRSSIISDGWASYADIEEIRGGIYCHDVVVYQDNFVALGDGSVHTQYIENTWFRAKRKRLKQCGTSADLFLSYLAEFMWRNRHNKEHYADALTNTIAIN